VSASPDIAGLSMAEVVEGFREAARILIRDARWDVREKCSALLRLAAKARELPGRASEDARIALYNVAREFLLDEEEVSPDAPSDPVELAARSLRAKGYAACPECARRLPDEVDFARWRSLRGRWVQEARARDEARARSRGARR
jgi:hypothetical protein